jgi:hypothetical protein
MLMDTSDILLLEQRERAAYIENRPEAALLGALIDLLYQQRDQEERDY